MPPQDTWVHIALVLSSSHGLRLYINAQLTTPQIKLQKSQLQSASSSDLLSATSKNYLDITELRFWQIALNQLIIRENNKMPLSMLSEQKRKIKV